jgi:DNA-binding CsgD family transcriptional regulator
MKERSPHCATMEPAAEPAGPAAAFPGPEEGLDRLLSRAGDPLDDEIITLVKSLTDLVARADALVEEMRALGMLAVRLADARERGPAAPRRPARIEAASPESRISTRERQVLSHLLRGMSNREISRELGISEKTVKNHLWKAYRKIGVRSRTQLFHHLISA